MRGMKFTKMHGCGNDYILVDCFREGESEDWPRLAREISDRHFGVGSDGLILVMPSDVADFRMRMFNSDGSEGEMCGNGMRCFAKYVYERGMARTRGFTVETLAGLIRPEVLPDGTVRVNMGRPSLKRGDVPVTGDPGEDAVGIEIDVRQRPMRATCVSMGNPHCVIVVDDLDAIDLALDGRAVETHPIFPRKANVEFVKVLARDHLRMRVWERGSGITMACGTGACASAVACSVNGLAERKVTVDLDGGTVEVEWSQDGFVYLTGPAEEICEGVFTKWKRASY